MYAISGEDLSPNNVFEQMSRLKIGRQYARIDNTRKPLKQDDGQPIHFDLLMLEKRGFLFRKVKEYLLVPVDAGEDDDNRLLFRWVSKQKVKWIEGNVQILSKPSMFSREAVSEVVALMPINSEMIIHLAKSSEQVYIPDYGWTHPEYFVFRWDGKNLSGEHKNRQWYYSLERDKAAKVTYL